MKICLLAIGKTLDIYAESINDYAKRINRYIPFSIRCLPEAKNTKNMTQELQKSAEGVMLATDYHPLLYRTKELLEILNSNKEGIKFSMYQYDWDMNNKELLEIKPFNPDSCK